MKVGCDSIKPETGGVQEQCPGGSERRKEMKQKDYNSYFIKRGDNMEKTMEIIMDTILTEYDYTEIYRFIKKNPVFLSKFKAHIVVVERIMYSTHRQLLLVKSDVEGNSNILYVVKSDHVIRDINDILKGKIVPEEIVISSSDFCKLYELFEKLDEQYYERVPANYDIIYLVLRSKFMVKKILKTYEYTKRINSILNIPTPLTLLANSVNRGFGSDMVGFASNFQDYAPFILIRDNIKFSKMIFGLAHEMRHIWQGTKGEMACYDSSGSMIEDYFKDPNEVDADAFAMYYSEMNGILWKPFINKLMSVDNMCITMRKERMKEVKLQYIQHISRKGDCQKR